MPSRRFPPRSRRVTALAGLALLATALPPAGAQPTAAPASAAQPAGEVAFSVPAQPLDQALNQLARQAGLQLLAPPALVQGVQAPAVQGRMAPAAAIAQLLRGTGLSGQIRAQTLVVERAPAASSATLSEVRVTGRAGADAATTTGPAGNYVARRSAAGTKTATALVETPQSISVVTAEEMQATKAQNLTDALAYTAGVFRTEGNDRTADRLFIRGFYSDAIEGSIYRDGLKSMVNAFNGKAEPYGLERVEVLKGAASVLYGSAGPGGVIHMVSKRPTADLVREVNVETGSYDRKQLSADLGGALTDDGVWTYRLTALARDSNTFVDFVPDDRTYIAPALKWQPSADTSLTLLSYYQKSRTKYVFGFPARGTVLPNPNGRIPENRYLGEPGRDRSESTLRSVGYQFEHAFSDRLRLRNHLNVFDAESTMPATWPLTGDFSDAALRTLPRFAESRREDASSAIAMDLSLEYRWDLGSTQNTLLVGTDHTRQKHRSARWLRMAAPLDAYDPVYGRPDLTPEVQRPYRASRRERHDLTGLYVQNQSRIADRWVLLLGGRNDWSRDRESPYFEAENWTRERSHAFSGRAGLVYLAPNGLAPFVSWSESFQPQSGTDRSGTRFQPTTGTQYEAGVRYQPEGRDLLLTAAVYQLTRQNVTTTDPVDNAFTVQTGEVRSRGLELEAKLQATRSLGLLAAYAYTDARTTRSNDPAEVGKRTGAVPRQQLSLWTDYAFGALGLPGWKAGAGVRFVGSSTATYIEGVRVPSYTLLDAMVGYETGPWRFTLNLSNLADRVHVTNCIDVCYYGEPRRVTAAASYRW